MGQNSVAWHGVLKGGERTWESVRLGVRRTRQVGTDGIEPEEK